MRTKVLITGSQDTIIDDFFTHTEEVFQCMSSSMRVNDIYTHMQYFEPEVFVYCLGKNKELDAEIIVAAKEYMKYSEVMLALIGEKESIAALSADLINSADVLLTKPISIKKIQMSIIETMEAKRAAAEKAEQDRIEAEKKKIEQEKQAQKEAEKAARMADPKHVLIIDDDPVMLRTVKHYLEEEYQVATAPSGKIAMKFLEQRKTDLILLDYEMPEMSGPDVLMLIRDNETTKNVPVVFLTGVTDKSKIKEVLAMQPDGYLLKPVDNERLHETIENLFAREE